MLMCNDVVFFARKSDELLFLHCETVASSNHSRYAIVRCARGGIHARHDDVSYCE